MQLPPIERLDYSNDETVTIVGNNRTWHTLIQTPLVIQYATEEEEKADQVDLEDDDD